MQPAVLPAIYYISDKVEFRRNACQFLMNEILGDFQNNAMITAQNSPGTLLSLHGTQRKIFYLSAHHYSALLFLGFSMPETTRSNSSQCPINPGSCSNNNSPFPWGQSRVSVQGDLLKTNSLRDTVWIVARTMGQTIDMLRRYVHDYAMLVKKHCFTVAYMFGSFLTESVLVLRFN